MYGIFLAMILFADDLCLLAPTRQALNKMIQLCADYCKEFGLTFNASKSKILVQWEPDLKTLKGLGIFGC